MVDDKLKKKCDLKINGVLKISNLKQLNRYASKINVKNGC